MHRAVAFAFDPQRQPGISREAEKSLTTLITVEKKTRGIAVKTLRQPLRRWFPAGSQTLVLQIIS